MADGPPQSVFSNAEACSKQLDSAWREEWQQADEIVSALAARDDLNVVDLGAGTGYFTTRLAKALPKGQILALDTEQSMVDWITNLASKQGLTNISAKVVSPDDPKLDEVPFKFDILLLGYTYHRIHMDIADARVTYFRDKVQPKMPDRATLVIIDLEGYPANCPFDVGHEHKHGHDHTEFFKPEQVKAELASAGFTLVTDYQFVAKPNYMLSFKVTK